MALRIGKVSILLTLLTSAVAQTTPKECGYGALMTSLHDSCPKDCVDLEGGAFGYDTPNCAFLTIYENFPEDKKGTCAAMLNSMTPTDLMCMADAMKLPETLMYNAVRNIFMVTGEKPTNLEPESENIDKMFVPEVCGRQCTTEKVPDALDPSLPNCKSQSAMEIWGPRCQNDACRTALKTANDKQIGYWAAAVGLPPGMARPIWKQTGEICGADMSHIVVEKTCESWGGMTLSAFGVLCPKECSNKPEEAAQMGISECPKGEYMNDLEFGKNCQIDSCQTMLASFTPWEVDCFSQIVGIDYRTSEGWLTAVGGMCQADMSKMTSGSKPESDSGKPDCGAFMATHMTPWYDNCLPECTQDANIAAADPRVEKCTPGQAEWGEKCQTDKCQKWLQSWNLNDVTCFGQVFGGMDPASAAGILRQFVAMPCGAGDLPGLTSDPTCAPHTKKMEAVQASCPRECTNGRGEVTDTLPLCKVGESEFGAKCQNEACQTAMAALDVKAVHKCSSDPGMARGPEWQAMAYVVHVAEACGATLSMDTSSRDSTCDDTLTHLAQFDLQCPKACTNDPSEMEKMGLEMCNGKPEWGKKCQTDECKTYLESWRLQDSKCIAKMFGAMLNTEMDARGAMGLMQGMATPCGVSDLSLMMQDKNCDAKLDSTHPLLTKCPLDCGTQQGKTLCSPTQDMWGTACKNADCKSYLESLTVQDIGCFKTFLGIENSEYATAVMQRAGQTCGASVLPSVKVDMSCAHFTDVVLDLLAACPNKCNSQKARAEMLNMDTCLEGVEEWDTGLCANTKCQDYIKSMTMEDTLCVKMSVEPDLQKQVHKFRDMEGSMKYISDKCQVTGTTKHKIFRTCEAKTFSTALMEWHAKCPFDCFSNQFTAAKLGVPVCTAGQMTMGIACKTATCASYLQSLTIFDLKRVMDPTCGPLDGEGTHPMTYFAQALESVADKCAANVDHMKHYISPVLKNEWKCDKVWFEKADQVAALCPRECAYNAAQAPDYPACGSGQTEYGATCKTDACKTILESFTEHEAWCFGLQWGMSWDKATAGAGVVKFIGDQCGVTTITLPTKVEDTACVEFQMSTFQQWSLRCPKDCTNEPEEITADLKACATGQFEYGTKCKATSDCADFLGSLRQKDTGCFAAMYGIKDVTKAADGIRGGIGKLCGAGDLPNLLVKPECTESAKTFTPEKMQAECPQTCKPQELGHVAALKDVPTCEFGDMKEAEYSTKCKSDKCSGMLAEMDNSHAQCMAAGVAGAEEQDIVNGMRIMAGWCGASVSLKDTTTTTKEPPPTEAPTKTESTGSDQDASSDSAPIGAMLPGLLLSGLTTIFL